MLAGEDTFLTVDQDDWLARSEPDQVLLESYERVGSQR